MFLLWLSVTICTFCPHSEEFLHAYSDGDIIIGGLFAIHAKTNRTTETGPAHCTSYDVRNFLRSQVMIFALEEINQRTPKLLPNLTLGYDIYDTCGDVTVAIRATLQLLKNQSDPQSCLLPVNISSDLVEPRTKALIGERYSEVSAAVARVVALSSVPQISYASTSVLLSRKTKFPTFLRTISSDEYQTKAIAELVKQFNWKIVAIVGSDDEYGKYGSDGLVANFREMNNTCVEFIEILPGDFSLLNDRTHEKLSELVSTINQSSAEAIIMFTHDRNVAIIMEEAIERNLNRTWIASDAWATSSNIFELPNIHRAGQVFGFISKRNEVPGFEDYVKSMFGSSQNPILQHYRSSHLPKECEALSSFIDQDESYNIYLAVQVVAEGLRSLLKCDNQHCKRHPPFPASELLTEIKAVNFTVNTTHVYFDINGDPSLGYDILYWNMSDSNRGIKTIGEYWPRGKIEIPEDLVEQMSSVMVTADNCSKTCDHGHELKLQERKCCRYCVPCSDGEFSPGNGTPCARCNESQYSSKKRDKCLEKDTECLRWTDPFVIILSSLEVSGIIVTIVFSILFTIHRNTPIVKAVGGYLCFLELSSLLFCFCLTLTYPGDPSKVSCMLALPLFGIAFSLCISCILANLLQILVGFKFQLTRASWLKKFNKPMAVVTIVFGIQVAICVPWLYFDPPVPKEHNQKQTILKTCVRGSSWFFAAMLGYNALLALICFGFAFKGKQLPDLYKNAGLVTISMVLYLVIWALFIPIHINLNGVYKHAIEGAAIVISSYSILGCHLAPKCYIMVFRKEINNEQAIMEHIKKHYEQKGISALST
ncbi:G-protein coupled receptor family C group 6 member A-like [Sphaeramia orbicularis]|uniref:G-protein coupled receptor family C group 6 member A-like n=1 Tax=Sphaeramia orbicularis TaxID=375764 RepID=A0A673CJG6_9TELE|nr:G-protein coupled receptor family C group 6 member A-like [Sphaeramia orbicularis]